MLLMESVQVVMMVIPLLMENVSFPPETPTATTGIRQVTIVLNAASDTIKAQ